MICEQDRHRPWNSPISEEKALISDRKIKQSITSSENAPTEGKPGVQDPENPCHLFQIMFFAKTRDLFFINAIGERFISSCDFSWFHFFHIYAQKILSIQL